MTSSVSLNNGVNQIAMAQLAMCMRPSESAHGPDAMQAPGDKTAVKGTEPADEAETAEQQLLTTAGELMQEYLRFAYMALNAKLGGSGVAGCCMPACGTGASSPASAPVAAGTSTPAFGSAAGCAPQSMPGGAPSGPSPISAPGGLSAPVGAGALDGKPQTSANTPGQSRQVAEQYIANLQKDFGLTRAQAAGIVGNLWHESAGMNSGMNQGMVVGQPSGNMADDNANGYGIAQWGGVRKAGLIAYAHKHGVDPSSQAANYGFLKQELQGEYSGAIRAVKASGTAEEATQAFAQAYEKPSDPQMGSRLKYTHLLLA